MITSRIRSLLPWFTSFIFIITILTLLCSPTVHVEAYGDCPSTGIYEIFGAQPGNVTLPTTLLDCEVRIHDITFTTPGSMIVFPPDISLRNTNISINNVECANSSPGAPPFCIYLRGVFSSPRAVTIQNVVLRDVVVSSATFANAVSAVVFERSYDGGWTSADDFAGAVISIKNVTVKNTVCDSSAFHCNIVAVRFLATMTIVNSLTVSQISVVGTNSAAGALCASYQQICVSFGSADVEGLWENYHVEISDLLIDGSGQTVDVDGPVLVIGAYFPQSTIRQSLTGILPQTCATAKCDPSKTSMIFNNIVLRNLDQLDKSARITNVLIAACYFAGNPYNIEYIAFQNILVSNVAAVAATGNAEVRGIHFQTDVKAYTSTLTARFVASNITLRDVSMKSSSSGKYADGFVVRFALALSLFESMLFDGLVADRVQISSKSVDGGNAEMDGLTITSISGRSQSDSPTSNFRMKNCLLSNILVSGYRDVLAIGMKTEDQIQAINSIEFSNVTLSNMTLVSEIHQDTKWAMWVTAIALRKGAKPTTINPDGSSFVIHNGIYVKNVTGFAADSSALSAVHFGTDTGSLYQYLFNFANVTISDVAILGPVVKFVTTGVIAMVHALSSDGSIQGRGNGNLIIKNVGIGDILRYNNNDNNNNSPLYEYSVLDVQGPDVRVAAFSSGAVDTAATAPSQSMVGVLINGFIKVEIDTLFIGPGFNNVIVKGTPSLDQQILEIVTLNFFATLLVGSTSANVKSNVLSIRNLIQSTSDSYFSSSSSSSKRQFQLNEHGFTVTAPNTGSSNLFDLSIVGLKFKHANTFDQIIVDNIAMTGPFKNIDNQVNNQARIIGMSIQCEGSEIAGTGTDTSFFALRNFVVRDVIRINSAVGAVAIHAFEFLYGQQQRFASIVMDNMSVENVWSAQFAKNSDFHAIYDHPLETSEMSITGTAALTVTPKYPAGTLSSFNVTNVVLRNLTIVPLPASDSTTFAPIVAAVSLGHRLNNFNLLQFVNYTVEDIRADPFSSNTGAVMDGVVGLVITRQIYGPPSPSSAAALDHADSRLDIRNIMIRRVVSIGRQRSYVGGVLVYAISTFATLRIDNVSVVNSSAKNYGFQMGGKATSVFGVSVTGTVLSVDFTSAVTQFTPQKLAQDPFYLRFTAQNIIVANCNSSSAEDAVAGNMGASIVGFRMNDPDSPLDGTTSVNKFYNGLLFNNIQISRSLVISKSNAVPYFGFLCPIRFNGASASLSLTPTPLSSTSPIFYNPPFRAVSFTNFGVSNSTIYGMSGSNLEVVGIAVAALVANFDNILVDGAHFKNVAVYKPDGTTSNQCIDVIAAISDNNAMKGSSAPQSSLIMRNVSMTGTTIRAFESNVHCTLSYLSGGTKQFERIEMTNFALVDSDVQRTGTASPDYSLTFGNAYFDKGIVGAGTSASVLLFSNFVINNTILVFSSFAFSPFFVNSFGDVQNTGFTVIDIFNLSSLNAHVTLTAGDANGLSPKYVRFLAPEAFNTLGSSPHVVSYFRVRRMRIANVSLICAGTTADALQHFALEIEDGFAEFDQIVIDDVVMESIYHSSTVVAELIALSFVDALGTETEVSLTQSTLSISNIAINNVTATSQRYAIITAIQSTGEVAGYSKITVANVTVRNVKEVTTSNDQIQIIAMNFLGSTDERGASSGAAYTRPIIAATSPSDVLFPKTFTLENISIVNVVRAAVTASTSTSSRDIMIFAATFNKVEGFEVVEIHNLYVDMMMMSSSSSSSSEPFIMNSSIQSAVKMEIAALRVLDAGFVQSNAGTVVSTTFSLSSIHIMSSRNDNNNNNNSNVFRYLDLNGRSGAVNVYCIRMKGGISGYNSVVIDDVIFGSPSDSHFVLSAVGGQNVVGALLLLDESFVITSGAQTPTSSLKITNFGFYFESAKLSSTSTGTASFVALHGRTTSGTSSISKFSSVEFSNFNIGSSPPKTMLSGIILSNTRPPPVIGRSSYFEASSLFSAVSLSAAYDVHVGAIGLIPTGAATDNISLIDTLVVKNIFLFTSSSISSTTTANNTATVMIVSLSGNVRICTFYSNFQSRDVRSITFDNVSLSTGLNGFVRSDLGNVVLRSISFEQEVLFNNPSSMPISATSPTIIFIRNIICSDIANVKQPSGFASTYISGVNFLQITNYQQITIRDVAIRNLENIEGGSNVNLYGLRADSAVVNNIVDENSASSFLSVSGISITNLGFLSAANYVYLVNAELSASRVAGYANVTVYRISAVGVANATLGTGYGGSRVVSCLVSVGALDASAIARRPSQSPSLFPGISGTIKRQCLSMTNMEMSNVTLFSPNWGTRFFAALLNGDIQGYDDITFSNIVLQNAYAVASLHVESAIVAVYFFWEKKLYFGSPPPVLRNGNLPNVLTITTTSSSAFVLQAQQYVLYPPPQFLVKNVTIRNYIRTNPDVIVNSNSNEDIYAGVYFYATSILTSTQTSSIMFKYLLPTPTSPPQPETVLQKFLVDRVFSPLEFRFESINLINISCVSNRPFDVNVATRILMSAVAFDSGPTLRAISVSLNAVRSASANVVLDATSSDFNITTMHIGNCQVSASELTLSFPISSNRMKFEVFLFSVRSYNTLDYPYFSPSYFAFGDLHLSDNTLQDNVLRFLGDRSTSSSLSPSQAQLMLRLEVISAKLDYCTASILNNSIKNNLFVAPQDQLPRLVPENMVMRTALLGWYSSGWTTRFAGIFKNNLIQQGVLLPSSSSSSDVSVGKTEIGIVFFGKNSSSSGKWTFTKNVIDIGNSIVNGSTNNNHNLFNFSGSFFLFTSPTQTFVPENSMMMNTALVLTKNVFLGKNASSLSIMKPSYSADSSSSILLLNSIPNTDWTFDCNRWDPRISKEFESSYSSSTTTMHFNCSITASISVSKTEDETHTYTITPPPTPTRTKTGDASLTYSLSLVATPSTSKSAMTISATKSNFATATPTVSLVPPRPVMIGDAVPEAAKALGMFLAALGGSATGGMNSRKIMAITSVADCGKVDVIDPEEVEGDGNPFNLRVGKNKFATQNGSIIGAMLMIVVWFCLMGGIGFVRSKLENCSWKRGFRKVGMPGTLAIPAFTLFPAAMNSVGSMVERHANPLADDENDESASKLDMAMIVVGFLIGAILPLVVLIWITLHVKSHEVWKKASGAETKVDELNNKITKKPSSQKDEKKAYFEINGEDMPKWKYWFEWLTEPYVEYKRSRFLDAYGPAYDNVSNPLYLVFGYLIVIGSEFTDGFVSLCGTSAPTCCKAGIVSIQTLAVLDLVLLVAFRLPFIVRSDRFFLPICILLTLTCATLTTIQFFSNYNSEETNPDLRTDFTNALLLLTQIAFYLATINGLLGASNEVILAGYDTWFILKERRRKSQEKKLGKNEELSSLERLLLEENAIHKNNNGENKKKFVNNKKKRRSALLKVHNDCESDVELEVAVEMVKTKRRQKKQSLLDDLDPLVENSHRKNRNEENLSNTKMEQSNRRK